MTDALSPASLAAARAICDKATPGPWESRAVKMPEMSLMKLGHVMAEGDYDVADHIPMRDAQFIALARTLLPALINRVEELEAQLSDDDREWPLSRINAAYEELCKKRDAEVERLRDAYEREKAP